MVENTVAGNTALPGGVESESGRGEGGGTMKLLEMWTGSNFTSHLYLVSSDMCSGGPVCGIGIPQWLLQCREPNSRTDQRCLPLCYRWVAVFHAPLPGCSVAAWLCTVCNMTITFCSFPLLHHLPALVVLSLVVLVTLGHGFLTAQKVGMMARIITTAAIYQKVGPFAQTRCCASNVVCSGTSLYL